MSGHIIALCGGVELGMPALAAAAVMTSDDDRVGLARETLAFASELSAGQHRKAS